MFYGCKIIALTGGAKQLVREKFDNGNRNRRFQPERASDEAVAGSGARDDIGAVVPELLAQTRDVDIDGAGRHGLVVAPDERLYLIARIEPARGVLQNCLS